jgi:hypothetical protein
MRGAASVSQWGVGLVVVWRALTGASSRGPTLADMSAPIKAMLSMAVAVAGVVAIATRATTLTDVIGGIVVLVAILVFARAIMNFASEPGEAGQRSNRRR